MPRGAWPLALLAVSILTIGPCGCARRPQATTAQGVAPTPVAPVSAPQSPVPETSNVPADENQIASPASGTSQTTAATAQPTQASSSESVSSDWPSFRGPNADGVSPLTRINKNWSSRPPRVLWQVQMSDDGFAVPSAADGKVFIIDHRGDQDVVRALDLNTGKDVWTYPYPDTSSPNYGFARAAPTYSEGKLYTQSRIGLLQCLDAKSGARVWARDLVKEFGGQRPQWDYSGSPLVDGNKLIVCPGGKTGVVALDKVTGRELWTGGVSGPPGYATPVLAQLDGRKQYVIFAGTVLYGVEASSGQTLWQTPWKTNYDVNAATPALVDGWVFVTSNYGVGCALYGISGGRVKCAWSSRALASHFNSAVYYQRFLFGISDHLVCLNPQNGQTMWRQPGFEKGGLVALDGVLIAVSGNSGDVVMVEAVSSAYRELGRTKPLGGQSWTPPIVAQGRLIVRNKRALACLDLM